MTAWGDEDESIRWSPLAHYDAGVTSIKDNDHLTALCHFAAGLLMMQINRA